jgi:hypothetical protein
MKTYNWWGSGENEPPPNLKTKKQLAELGLSVIKDCSPSGAIETRKYTLYLYDPDNPNQVRPKRSVSEKQKTALSRYRQILAEAKQKFLDACYRKFWKIKINEIEITVIPVSDKIKDGFTAHCEASISEWGLCLIHLFICHPTPPLLHTEAAEMLARYAKEIILNGLPSTTAHPATPEQVYSPDESLQQWSDCTVYFPDGNGVSISLPCLGSPARRLARQMGWKVIED